MFTYCIIFISLFCSFASFVLHLKVLCIRSPESIPKYLHFCLMISLFFLDIGCTGSSRLLIHVLTVTILSVNLPTEILSGKIMGTLVIKSLVCMCVLHVNILKLSICGQVSSSSVSLVCIITIMCVFLLFRQ